MAHSSILHLIAPNNRHCAGARRTQRRREDFSNAPNELGDQLDNIHDAVCPAEEDGAGLHPALLGRSSIQMTFDQPLLSGSCGPLSIPTSSPITCGNVASASPRRWGCFPARGRPTAPSTIWPAMSWSGAQVFTTRRWISVRCAAGRATSIRTSPAQPAASGSPQSPGSTAADFGWCVSPISGPDH